MKLEHFDALFFYLIAGIFLIGLPSLIGAQAWIALSPAVGIIAGGGVLLLIVEGGRWLLDQGEDGQQAELADVADLNPYTAEEGKNVA
ncbi:hypothetical protein [uncultured Corynebacterium sp.]|uniref:hypothetical protein n=1 Tax=uncultured Corynebacterium sp. TaxID=159447 RepID=UPI002624F97E|nr:hypothetical protein [uncultured Corynebacterium sp.]